ncbi:MAG: uracil-DNA glycosylase [Oscillospiraceae bacterium]|nr:uracil-DNA glycosylase [Oscillospiraceae bacterium]
MNKPIKINCFQCKHFAVTWEPKYPKACNLFEFKSEKLPSLVIFHSTGTPCTGFEEKDK